MALPEAKLANLEREEQMAQVTLRLTFEQTALVKAVLEEAKASESAAAQYESPSGLRAAGKEVPLGAERRAHAQRAIALSAVLKEFG
jgi:hypothetical protein